MKATIAVIVPGAFVESVDDIIASSRFYQSYRSAKEFSLSRGDYEEKKARERQQKPVLRLQKQSIDQRLKALFEKQQKELKQ